LSDEKPVTAEEVLDTAKGRATHWGTGRRKTSVARVRLICGGDGQFVVNKRNLESFFNVERLRNTAKSPLVSTSSTGQFDVFVNVVGGGIMGQAGAIRLGLARALLKVKPDMEETLRNEGHLTRDSRMVERKHYGRRGARRGFQFSKR
jgi:small subunit ribosomal protein S9